MRLYGATKLPYIHLSKKQKKKNTKLRDGARAKGLGAKFRIKKNKKKQIATSRIIYFGSQFNILSSIWVNNSNLIVEIGYVFKTMFFGLMFCSSLLPH